MTTVTEAKELDGDPLGDLAREIIEEIFLLSLAVT